MTSALVQNGLKLQFTVKPLKPPLLNRTRQLCAGHMDYLMHHHLNSQYCS